MAITKLCLSFLAFVLLIGCSYSSDVHREEGKIFHAAPMSGGIGALYFALYNDHTYQICNSGGIGQDCYSGKFKLDNDTLMFFELNRDVPLKSNKLLIIRYIEQDSNYWKWKYFNSPNQWQDLKSQDTNNGLGDVYQLDSNNNILNGVHDQHFIIRLDSLENNR